MLQGYVSSSITHLWEWKARNFNIGSTHILIKENAVLKFHTAFYLKINVAVNLQ